MTTYTLGYQKSRFGNVGDDLNPWLMTRMLPNIEFADSERVLLCIGSILVSDRWDQYKRKLVLGSGARSLARRPVIDASWDFRFVRGPRSAAALNVPFISDPALLVSRFVAPAKRRKGIGIVPYYRSNRRVWQAVAAQIGARVISPHLDVDSFVEELNSCERVFCEAMHGAIFADALRIPWRPVCFQNVAFEGETHHFKWQDWSESVNIAFDPLVQSIEKIENWSTEGYAAKFSAAIKGLRISRELATLLKQGLRNGAFYLSERDVLEDRIERMAEAFAAVDRNQ